MVNDDKKYNILFVHNFYKKPGGEDTVFNNEVKLLGMHGHNVYTYTRDNKEIDSLPIYKKIFLPLIYIFNPKTYFDIKKIIKENNIDIIHCHNTWGLISQSVYYAGVNMNIPVIQTMHNFRLLCPNALFYTNKHICEDCVTKGFQCAIKNKCYRNSKLQTIISVLNIKFHRMTGVLKKINFIAVTEFNKEKLLLLNEHSKKNIIDEKKVFVKPNFVFDDRNYEIVPVEERKYYLYVGRLDEIKGIDTVLEAFSKLPDKELHVIGSGGEEYIKQYKKYNNIKFLGQLTHDKVMIEMQNGKALLFSSKLYETFGMTIIEAYKNSLPVISSNVGNAKQLVGNGKTGIHFEVGSVDSLFNAIIKLNCIDINKLKSNSYFVFLDNFTCDINYNKVINIYNQL